MVERWRLNYLLDRLGVRNERARETIVLILEIDPTLKHPIEYDYQLVGERIGIGYKAVLYRIHDGIKRAWSKPTPELDILFNASICKRPVKPRYFLRTIKEILDKERSSQHDTD